MDSAIYFSVQNSPWGLFNFPYKIYYMVAVLLCCSPAFAARILLDAEVLNILGTTAGYILESWIHTGVLQRVCTCICFKMLCLSSETCSYILEGCSCCSSVCCSKTSEVILTLTPSASASSLRIVQKVFISAAPPFLRLSAGYLFPVEL